MTGRQSIRCAVERMLWRGVFMALAAVFLTVLLPVLWDLFSPFLAAPYGDSPAYLV